MKKQGFTLIELLAVIVVLAIIALIAVPIILGVIEKAEKGAAKASALGYIDAVEKQIMINQMDNDATNDIVDGNYDVSTLNSMGVKVKGKSLDATSRITISNRQVTTVDLKVGKYKVEGNAQNNTIDVTTGESIGDNESEEESGNNEGEEVTYRLGEKTIGDAVYVNPETNEICDLASYTANTNASKTGNKAGCMKWYVYRDNGNGTYRLILDHNTTAAIAWVSKADYIAAGGTEAEYGWGNNNRGPITVQKQLKDDTKTWNSSLNTRLITVDEVAEIIGNITFNEAESSLYNFVEFDTNTATYKYGWLYDRTAADCTNRGCLNNSEESIIINGYWTSSLVSSIYNGAWLVSSRGDFAAYDVGSDLDLGVRPVITF